MTIEERVQALIKLGDLLAQKNDLLEAVVQKAYAQNRWFIPENSHIAIEAIRKEFLIEDKLRAWIGQYSINNIKPKKVGLILAGNIPLVGLHDLLAVFMSGHIALLKLSSKDTALMQFVIDSLAQIDPRTKSFIQVVERLKDFEVVIATGSDNTARYFKTYFEKYPNIIRHNRNSVAILTGFETQEERRALGQDIFSYFGLGCRNVSKIYVPKGYDFQPLLEDLHEYNQIVLNDKYKNNLDYAFTLYIMNKEFYMNNGCIILHEAKSLSSRISTLHYEFYEDMGELCLELGQMTEQIQCVVAKDLPSTLPKVDFGQTQSPSLMDYADGIDVMEFLLNC